MKSSSIVNSHIRPYLCESTGSRPLSPSQTHKSQISTQVGDDWGILGVVCLFDLVSFHIHTYLSSTSTLNSHIRPYPCESTGSRPLSPRQTHESQISSWVGDDQRIPGVVCFCPIFAEAWSCGSISTKTQVPPNCGMTSGWQFSTMLRLPRQRVRDSSSRTAG